MDWENLKHFFAVAKSGSLAGAGRQLGVKHTTVMRRVAELEKGLGSKLFERHPTGYLPTAAGKELFAAVRPVEEELVAIGRRLSGLDQRLSGTVRIASLDPLSPWICEAIARLRRGNPGLVTEMLISSDAVSIAKHEADIAVRVTVAPPENLVGRRIAALAHGVYAAAGQPVADDFAGHDWLSYTDARRTLPQAQWVSRNVPAERVVFRTNHTASLVQATRAGIGLAVLPRYVGDREPGIRCIAPLRGFGQELWLLTHQDLRRTRRIRILMDCLADELLAHRDLIEGHPAP
jgi:DNA-binding transcriptional LysR family regulator